MKCVFISRAWCMTLSIRGVLSVLQQQLEVPLAEEGDEPAPRRCRKTALRRAAIILPSRRSRVKAPPRYRDEPAAPRFNTGGSRESAASGSSGGAAWPHAQPGYQKNSRVRFIANCWIRRPRSANPWLPHRQRKACRAIAKALAAY